MMQSSNIIALATLFVFVAVFAQAAYSLSYNPAERSKRLFWVDKKSADSPIDKRLFWVDKKSPEKRLFWVDKKSPEKRLFWVDKKSAPETELEKRLFWVDKKNADVVPVSIDDIDKIADCIIQVVTQYGKHIEEQCKQEDSLSKSCVEEMNEKRTQANFNCLTNYS